MPGRTSIFNQQSSSGSRTPPASRTERQSSRLKVRASLANLAGSSENNLMSPNFSETNRSSKGFASMGSVGSKFSLASNISQPGQSVTSGSIMGDIKLKTVAEVVSSTLPA